MAATYAVTWKDSDGSIESGRLELGPRSLRLVGANSLEVAENDVLGVCIVRGSGDRIGGRMTILLSRRDGRPLWIAPVAQRAALGELHDGLSALSGNASSSE